MSSVLHFHLSLCLPTGYGAHFLLPWNQFFTPWKTKKKTKNNNNNNNKTEHAIAWLHDYWISDILKPNFKNLKTRFTSLYLTVVFFIFKLLVTIFHLWICYLGWLFLLFCLKLVQSGALSNISWIWDLSWLLRNVWTHKQTDNKHNAELQRKPPPANYSNIW